MNRMLTRGARGGLLLCGLVLVVSGCKDQRATPETSAPGCTRDTDCKGDRICKAGACVDVPVTPGAPGAPPAPTRSPGPGAPADPGAMAADGLPAFIPTPGSAPPTLAEWNAITREVTVKGSSALGCETKMLREWLRVSCKTHDSDTPTSVKSTQKPDAVQAYVFQGTGVSSVVVQVVRAQDYRATFGWTTHDRPWEAVLTVRWPAGAPRPTLSFDR